MSWGAFLFNSFRDAAERSSYRVVVKCGSEGGKKKRGGDTGRKRGRRGRKAGRFVRRPGVLPSLRTCGAPGGGRDARTRAGSSDGGDGAAFLLVFGSPSVAFGYELAGSI